MLSVMLAAGANPNLSYGSRDDGTLYDWAAYDYVLEIGEYPFECTGSPIYDLDAESLSDEDAWLKQVDDMAVQHGCAGLITFFFCAGTARNPGWNYRTASSRIRPGFPVHWKKAGQSRQVYQASLYNQPGLADAIQLLTSVIRQEGDLIAPGLADRLIGVHPWARCASPRGNMSIKI